MYHSISMIRQAVPSTMTLLLSCRGAAARPQVGLCLCVAVYFGLLLTGLVPDRVSLAVALSLPIVSCVASVTGAPYLRDHVSGHTRTASDTAPAIAQVRCCRFPACTSTSTPPSSPHRS